MVGSGCAALTGDTGADELQEFLSVLERGDLAGAAALTTDPVAAEEALTASVAGMGYPRAVGRHPRRRPAPRPRPRDRGFHVGPGGR